MCFSDDVSDFQLSLFSNRFWSYMFRVVTETSILMVSGA